MSLINCPECWKPVSEAADACPRCNFTFTPDVVAAQKAKRQKTQQVAGLIALGFFAFTILICSGVFTSSSSSPSAPSSSSTSISSGSHYDDATDSQLKDLPCLRGYSDREKEQIISASKKLTNAVNELERQRGY